MTARGVVLIALILSVLGGFGGYQVKHLLVNSDKSDQEEGTITLGDYVESGVEASKEKKKSKEKVYS